MDAMKYGPEVFAYLRKETEEGANKCRSVCREQHLPGDENHGWYAVASIRLSADSTCVQETGLLSYYFPGCRSLTRRRTT